MFIFRRSWSGKRERGLAMGFGVSWALWFWLQMSGRTGHKWKEGGCYYTGLVAAMILQLLNDNDEGAIAAGYLACGGLLAAPLQAIVEDRLAK